MATAPVAPEMSSTARARLPIGAGLLIGGVLFFVGGGMHPKEDPAGVTLKEHMRVMFEDSGWYPSHTLLFLGVAIIAAALVALVRGRGLVPLVHAVARVAAVTSSLAAAGMLLHLVAAVESHKIAVHENTPIVDVQVIVETITVPAFGLSMAALAAVGALTRTLGNPVTALLGVAGGLGFALAGGTFLFTDRFDFLFPAASGIAIWAAATGIGMLVGHRRTSTP